MSKHKQPGGIWTAQYAHCAMVMVTRRMGVQTNLDEDHEDQGD